MTCGIYRIVNLRNDCQYIGQSVHVEYRLRKHLTDLKYNNHHSHSLQLAWNERDSDKQFEFVLIEECLASELNDRESLLILSARPNVYNTKRVGGRKIGHSITLDDGTYFSSKSEFCLEFGIELHNLTYLHEYPDYDDIVARCRAFGGLYPTKTRLVAAQGGSLASQRKQRVQQRTERKIQRAALLKVQSAQRVRQQRIIINPNDFLDSC